MTGNALFPERADRCSAKPVTLVEPIDSSTAVKRGFRPQFPKGTA